MIKITVELNEEPAAQALRDFIVGLCFREGVNAQISVSVVNSSYEQGRAVGYAAAVEEAARVVAGMKVYATSDEDDSVNDVLARAVAVLQSLQGFTPPPPAPPKPIDDDDDEMDDFWLGLTGDEIVASDEDTGAITVWEMFDQITTSDESGA